MTAALGCVVVVVVGKVIVWKMASGALVVGPVNVATLHALDALFALRLDSFCSVTSISAVQPAVAVVKQSMMSVSNLQASKQTHNDRLYTPCTLLLSTFVKLTFARCHKCAKTIDEKNVPAK